VLAAALVSGIRILLAKIHLVLQLFLLSTNFTNYTNDNGKGDNGVSLKGGAVVYVVGYMVSYKIVLNGARFRLTGIQ
jgi:hypothetical protein